MWVYSVALTWVLSPGFSEVVARDTVLKTQLEASISSVLWRLECLRSLLAVGWRLGFFSMCFSAQGWSQLGNLHVLEWYKREGGENKTMLKTEASVLITCRKWCTIIPAIWYWSHGLFCTVQGWGDYTRTIRPGTKNTLAFTYPMPTEWFTELTSSLLPCDTFKQRILSPFRK